MVSTAIMLIGLCWQGVAFASPTHWQTLYGDELLFEVYREGQPVGTYRQRFSGDDQRWQTHIEMQLQIPVLFWTYRYRYQAQEQWQGDRLTALTVLIDRNGKVEKQRLTGAMISQLQAQTGTTLLPTHHYDVRITEQQNVFNTLSWEPNQVAIRPLETGPVEAGERSLFATRYRYEGELNNVEAWYDRQGRWVGLRFKDERGAPMELRCVRCGQGAFL